MGNLKPTYFALCKLYLNKKNNRYFGKMERWGWGTQPFAVGADRGLH